jgi:hypothetical protein
MAHTMIEENYTYIFEDLVAVTLNISSRSVVYSLSPLLALRP